MPPKRGTVLDALMAYLGQEGGARHESNKGNNMGQEGATAEEGVLSSGSGQQQQQQCDVPPMVVLARISA